MQRGKDKRLNFQMVKKSPPAVTATVKIVSRPIGSEVIIANRSYGITPLTLNLPPGNYLLGVVHRGYRTFYQDIRLKPGKNPSVLARLKQKDKVDN